MTPELVTNRLAEFQHTIAELERTLECERKIAQAIEPLIPRLGDTVRFYPGGGHFLAYVYTREDLQILMTLSPVWTKVNGSSGIYYESRVNDNQLKAKLTLYAQDGALPPTCKVETIVEVEPAIPERTITRTVVKCYFSQKDDGVEVLYKP